MVYRSLVIKYDMQFIYFLFSTWYYYDNSEISNVHKTNDLHAICVYDIDDEAVLALGFSMAKLKFMLWS